MTVLPPGVILVPCSTQYLATIESEWSAPVRVKADRQDDGTYELIMQLADARGTVVDCEMCIPCPVHAPTLEADS